MKLHLAIGAALVALATARAGAASLLLTNGRIYTANDAQPRAESVLAVDGRIAFVGAASEAKRRAPADARVIDLAGRTLLPGLVDAHAHLGGIGERELSFNLEGVRSVAELQARLKQRAAETRGGWLTGRGWIESQWQSAVFPTRADLDAVVADRPVVLTRADGHALVANTRALQLAGVDRTTPDPAGGQVLRDPQGEPTGMLIDRAMELVRHLVPAATADETVRAFEVGAQRELSLGWTQVHVAGASTSDVAIMRRLVADGKMKLRVYVAVSGPGEAAEQLMRDGAIIGETGGRFTVRGIKCYIDGALGSRGAALLEPYSDAPASRGLLVNREETLRPLLVRALRAGLQVETHAIGDRGNRIMLDLYEQAFAAVPRAERKVAEPRWRIEHAQVLAPADIPRFAALGVIASMQPSHAIGDLYFAPQRLGPARLRGAYAWRSLLDAGAVVVGGSDAPVERGEPMIEFYAAVARRALNGFANDDWHREQRVSRAEALKLFTLWPAFASFEEHERGSIEVGKAADFSVLSADIMEIPEAEILKTRCEMTVVGGEIVGEKK
jgi:predicted amidohydrolase YtcJ